MKEVYCLQPSSQPQSYHIHKKECKNMAENFETLGKYCTTQEAFNDAQIKRIGNHIEVSCSCVQDYFPFSVQAGTQ